MIFSIYLIRHLLKLPYNGILKVYSIALFYCYYCNLAIKGVYKWLNRVWRLVQDHIENVSSSWQPRNDMGEIKKLLAGSNRAIKEVIVNKLIFIAL